MSDFVGFVGPAYQAPSIYQDAQESINWYPEIDPTKPEGSRGTISLYPTPGLLTKITNASAVEVRALYVLPGGATMLMVVGPTVYTVNSSLVTTSVGTLLSSGGRVSISDNGVSAYLVDGANRYTYNIATTAFATIASTDGAFTGGDLVDQVDSFFVYNRPGTNQWGASTAASTVSPALSFGSMNSPGNLVSLIANHREVILFGETVTEFWTNAGAYPFPFQIIPGTQIQHGCAAKFSPARLGESVAWLSQDTRGNGIVIMLAGYQPQRISTHAVENDISGGVISDAISYTYQQEGHEFYVLTFPTQNKTWVYDLASQMWHKRVYRDNFNIWNRHRSNCHALFQGLNLVGDYSNGLVYSLDRTVFTDNGQPILRLRRAPHITKDLNRLFHSFLQIQFQPGVGTTTGQGSTPSAMLRWSDDGGSTWSNVYTLPIGKIGQYKNRCVKRRLGWARDRVYEVSVTDPIFAVIVSAELRLTAGVS